MKKIIISAAIFLSYLSIAYAQIGPGGPCGTSTGNPCYVTPTGSGGSTTVTQGPQASSASGNTWFVQQYLAGSAVSLTNPVPVTPGTGSTFPISASSLPLPTGAATDASLTNVQSAPGTPQTTAVTVQGNSSGIPINDQIIQGGSVLSNSNGIYTRPQGFTSTSFNGTAPNGSFASVLSANSSRNGCTIQNTSGGNEFVFFGANGSATTAKSIRLTSFQTISCSIGNIVLTDNISIEGSTASATYSGFSQ